MQKETYQSEIKPELKKVLLFVVCYNAEHTIEPVLNRIPDSVWDSPQYQTEILIIDDQSPDKTFNQAEEYRQKHPNRKITVLYNPKNLGYGGNQKVGYHYAIKYNFDVVVLLHGDGQYAPESIPAMIAPIIEMDADAVFGSRMLHRIEALKGKMPFYKWIGNQILTFIQNRVLRSSLSEFHSGFRAYRVSVLKELPFQYNADYFDFDTDIIIQLFDTGKKIKEIPIPTFYGDEICRVNGIKYAIKILRSCVLSRLNKLGLYYHPKFDYTKNSNTVYKAKFGFPSSHQFAYDLVPPQATVLDFGCGPGFMARALSSKGVKTISIDKQIQDETKTYSHRCIEADIDNYVFDDIFGKVDVILLLDIIEHLKSPESFLLKLRAAFSGDSPDVIVTTGNVGFFLVRLSLLMGSFNFGRHGILDIDHTRLFTFSSLTRLLKYHGYEIVQTKGIPAPFPLAIKDGVLARVFLALNCFLIKISKSLFAFQIGMQVKPLPTLERLLENAQLAKEQKINELFNCKDSNEYSPGEKN